MKWKIKKYNELSLDELYEILKIRSDVFVVEQECVFLDIDSLDKNAIHIFLENNNEIIAYSRILNKGVSFDEMSIGRVLVKKEYRKNKYARILMQKSIDYIQSVIKEEKITISAQYYLLDFYTSLGFQKASDIYLEDGIEHIKMKFFK